MTTITVMRNKPSNALWKDFGVWVKARREQLGMTQGDAARKANIDRQQWYRIEAGKSGTKRDTAIAIANALNADVNDTLQRSGFNVPDARPRTVPELLAAIERLGVDQILFAGGLEALAEMGEDDLNAILESLRDALEVSLHRRMRKKT